MYRDAEGGVTCIEMQKEGTCIEMQKEGTCIEMQEGVLV